MRALILFAIFYVLALALTKPPEPKYETHDSRPETSEQRAQDW